MSDEQGWYSDEQATLGDRIAAAREAAGLSQTQLATRLGVRSRTLRGWESDLSEPRANRLQMMAAMLGVSLRWLLSGEGEGVAPPLTEDEARDEAMQGTLAELRSLRGELLKMGERVGQLEKRLRKHVGAAG
ncbi:MAG: helix-turn-helix transcriptional regulator [Pararhodobacter sp.]|nr:helix-turn-helix transcriptional regulator [Pararhodobacter sp.]